jgi:hypothetical protein
LKYRIFCGIRKRVEQSPHQPKVEGLSAAAAATGRKKAKKNQHALPQMSIFGNLKK